MDWIIDPYQVSEDNRWSMVNDSESIVKLIAQVVNVSLETVRILKALSAEYTVPVTIE